MATNYLTFYAQFQSLIDSINHDSDAKQKLSNLQNLHKDAIKLLIRSRDEAAYDLRSNYVGEECERITGISRKSIDYWARRWMKQNSLPRLKGMQNIDFAKVINLSIKYPRIARTKRI